MADGDRTRDERSSQDERHREHGEFLAPRPPQIENLALGGIVLTVVLVEGLLLR